MVDFEGATKVLDFGIARAKGSERRTQAGMVRGTTAYMSPEQAIGKELDPRTDLFSLGTIFHELLTGQRLFYKGNPGQEMAAVYEGEIPLPSKVNRRVPKALDAVVMQILERKLDKRYQTALELIRDLSLAAGSTAWSKERCAELVRERFSARQKDIEKLVIRIPNRAPPQAASARGPRLPRRPHHRGQGPAGAAQRLRQRGAHHDRRRARWAIDGPPSPPSRAARSRPIPVGRRWSQPRPVTPAPQPAHHQGLDADQLFDPDDQDHDAPARPASSPMARSGSLPAHLGACPPTRAGPPCPREQPAGLLAAACWWWPPSLVLLLGAVGGAFIFRSMQAPPVAPATVVHFSLSADRPVVGVAGQAGAGHHPRVRLRALGPPPAGAAREGGRAPCRWR